jgi:hypothetical protein
MVTLLVRFPVPRRGDVHVDEIMRRLPFSSSCWLRFPSFWMNKWCLRRRMDRRRERKAVKGVWADASGHANWTHAVNRSDGGRNAELAGERLSRTHSRGGARGLHHAVRVAAVWMEGGIAQRSQFLDLVPQSRASNQTRGSPERLWAARRRWRWEPLLLARHNSLAMETDFLVSAGSRISVFVILAMCGFLRFYWIVQDCRSSFIGWSRLIMRRMWIGEIVALVLVWVCGELLLHFFIGEVFCKW